MQELGRSTMKVGVFICAARTFGLNSREFGVFGPFFQGERYLSSLEWQSKLQLFASTAELGPAACKGHVGGWGLRGGPSVLLLVVCPLWGQPVFLALQTAEGSWCVGRSARMGRAEARQSSELLTSGR